MLRRMTRVDRVRVLLNEAARILTEIKSFERPLPWDLALARTDDDIPTVVYALGNVENALQAVEDGIFSGEFLSAD